MRARTSFRRVNQKVVTRARLNAHESSLSRSCAGGTKLALRSFQLSTASRLTQLGLSSMDGGIQPTAAA